MRRKSNFDAIMIVFGIHCNFFIDLPIRLKTCRSDVLFPFDKAKCKRPKNRVRLRGFPRPIDMGHAIFPGLILLHYGQIHLPIFPTNIALCEVASNSDRK